ncbi:MAG TPA: isochorismatase family protein [Armatimonadota bacterium]|nr:isochorismatase family protein [Armatimonadota bacterium]
MQVPIRRYRLYPKSMREEDFSAKSFAAEERLVDISPSQSAIISVDTWNNCYGDEPFYPEKGRFSELTYLGNGSEVARKIRDILDNRIALLFAAARRCGVQLIHSMPGYIADRDCYRPYHLYPDMEVEAPTPQEWPPAEFRQALSDEITRWTWGEQAPQEWPAIRAKMDFAPPVAPVPGDIVMPQDHATVPKLQRHFRKRGIDTLFFVGFLANACLLYKPGALVDMGRRLGYRCIVLRDCCQTTEYEDTIDDFATQRIFTKLIETGPYFTSDSKALIEAMEGTPNGGADGAGD